MKSLVIGFMSLAFLTLTGFVAAANVGSAAHIAAVTAAVRQNDSGKHVDEVHVVADYALLKWHWVPEGHGYLGYKRVSDEHWKQIASGGSEGAVGNKGNGATATLARSGVPASIINELCSKWQSPSPCPDY